MQSSIEKIDVIKRLVKVTVPVSEVQSSYEQALKTLEKKRRIDGFRKGHVPKEILVKNFGAEALERAVDSNIRKAMVDVIDTHKLEVINNPEVIIKSKVGLDTDLVLEFLFFVPPSLSNVAMRELDVKLLTSNVKEEDVDSMIERLREQGAIYKDEENAVVDEHTIAVIDFLGKKDGVPFEGGEARDFSLNVAQDNMIPGFTSQIVGHKKGDKFVIDVTFPDEYHAKDLAGAKATFDIEVKEVKTKILPEVDVEFVKKYGIDSGDINTLREELKKNMSREVELGLIMRNSFKCVEAVIGKLEDFELPEIIMKNTYIQLAFSRMPYAAGKDREKFESFFEQNFEAKKNDKEAMKTVKEMALQALIHDAMVNEFLSETIKDKAKYDAYLNEYTTKLAAAYENSADVLDELRKDPTHQNKARQFFIDSSLIAYVKERAKVTEEEVPCLSIISAS